MKIRTLHSPNRILQIGDRQAAFHDGIADVEDLELAKFICSLKGFEPCENNPETSGSKSVNQDEPICEKPMESSSEVVENPDDNPENPDETVSLEELSATELKKMAKEAGVYKSGMTKQEMIDALK